MYDSTQEDTTKRPVPDPEVGLWPETISPRVQVSLGALSHPGRVRANNEDHYLVVHFGRWLQTVFTNLPEGEIPARAGEVGYALLVADGIGGAAAGETASRLAIATLVSLVLHTPDWILSSGEKETDEVLERMAQRFRRIDSALRGYARADPRLEGMGTTMTMACSLGASLVLCHIGDSRAYLLRDGVLVQLTRDHTMVRALLSLGKITPEEAATHPFRHVLTHSLGGGYRLDGDFQRTTLADGDQLLLCTDGLTDMVDTDNITAVLCGAKTSQEACQQLVDLALRNGGKDNVTVALARYRLPS
jgi:serine/threonine protein phosphatase PrpC